MLPESSPLHSSNEKEAKSLNPGTLGNNQSNYKMDDGNIGKTFISEKHSNSIDSFWIILNSDVLINPFDFVSVDNFNNTKTIGIVKEMERVVLPFASAHSGSVPTFMHHDKNTNTSSQMGVTIAKIAVMANIPTPGSTNDGGGGDDDGEKKTERKNTQLQINMPMEEGKPVVFAGPKEVIEALGIPEMLHPIPAGIIEMTNGTRVPIHLDVSYIFGPDTVHVNAAGISGNMKTGYLLFLLQVVYHVLSKEGISLIVFNTKENQLLFVDKDNENSDKNATQKDKDMYELLNMEMKRFTNVKYFLPRGKNGKPNSAYIPEGNYRTYSYELSDIYDRLELLFPSETTHDPQHNISSILNYVYESWSGGENDDNIDNSSSTDKNLKKIKNWTDLIYFDDYPEEIVTHKSTLLKFQGSIQRFRKPSTLFVDKKVTSTYLGKEIKKIRKGDVFVVDIARLSTLEEQALVVGDVMRTIDEMHSLVYVTTTTNDNDNDNDDDGDVSIAKDNNQDDYNHQHGDNKNEDKGNMTQGFNTGGSLLPQKPVDGNDDGSKLFAEDADNKPKYTVIFIDEINRFLPHLDFPGMHTGPTTLFRSAVAEEIIKTLIAGKSRHTALLSAQQFKSQVDPVLNYNTGLHMIAKLGLSELSTPSYSMIDDTTKSAINKLNKGETVMVHSAFRHPIKITIPKPTFKRP
ncbi:MAG: hypothetical protein M3162_08325 [Thermoproteota archaeon]|nr:hypothetical protein [Thermoproteota archaeon]